MKNLNLKIVIVLLLIGLSSILAATRVIPLEEVSKPRLIAASDTKFFVSETGHVLVYSLKNGKFLKKLGSKGQGPGEFVRQPFVIFDSKHIILQDRAQRKLVYYSLDLKFIKEERISFPLYNFEPIAENLVVERNVEHESLISIVSRNFKVLKNIAGNKDRSRGLGAFRYNITPEFSFRCWRDDIFVVDGRKGFHIGVFDKKGKLLREIKKNYVKVKYSAVHKDILINTLKALIPGFSKINPNEWTFPEYMPDIQDFMVNSGKIYVKTHSVKEGKEEYIIMDLMGRELKRVYLPQAIMCSFAFANNCFYHVPFNDDIEEWELHIIENL